MPFCIVGPSTRMRRHSYWYLNVKIWHICKLYIAYCVKLLCEPYILYNYSVLGLCHRFYCCKIGTAKILFCLLLSLHNWKSINIFRPETSVKRDSPLKSSVPKILVRIFYDTKWHNTVLFPGSRGINGERGIDGEQPGKTEPEQRRHHGVTFVFARSRQRHLNQSRTLNKDDTVKSVLYTNPSAWSWKFHPIHDSIPMWHLFRKDIKALSQISST